MLIILVPSRCLFGKRGGLQIDPSGMLGCLSDTCIGIGDLGGIADWYIFCSLLFRFAVSALEYCSLSPRSHRIAIPLYVVTMALRSLIVSTLAAQASAVWLAGVNIAGCEIGIDTSVSDTTFQSY